MIEFKIKYFDKISESRLIKVNANEEAVIADIISAVSQMIDAEVEVLPVNFQAILSNQTLGEYYQSIKGKDVAVHFVAIHTASIDQYLKSIIDHFKVNHASSLLTSTNIPKEIILSLSQLLPEDVKHSLLVRLADEINMFGQTVKDTLTHTAQRESVQVHPYAWLAAGVSNIVVCEDVFNELYVAVVHNQRRNPSNNENAPPVLILPEGFLHPKPSKGGDTGIATLSFSTMNAAEELILKNVPMQQAYAIASNHVGVTTTDNLSGQPLSDTRFFDTSLKQCSMRKIHEEIHLKVTEPQVNFVAQYEKCEPRSFLVNTYLVNLHSQVSPPILQADGLDIKEALWAKVRGLHITENLQVLVDYYDVEGNLFQIPIQQGYSVLIGQALAKLRDDQIRESSKFETNDELFSSRKNVESRVRQLLSSKLLNKSNLKLADVVGISPEDHLQQRSNVPYSEKLAHISQLGKYAFEYHAKIMALSRAFKNCPVDKLLTVEQLKEIVSEDPKIRASLSRSAATLFPLLSLMPKEKQQPHQISSIPRPMTLK